MSQTKERNLTLMSQSDGLPENQLICCLVGGKNPPPGAEGIKRVRVNPNICASNYDNTIIF